jgi:hypothetical protein
MNIEVVYDIHLEFLNNTHPELDPVLYWYYNIGAQYF